MVKDLRLLGLERHPASQDSLPETIARLKAEIARGSEVYSEAELQRLTRKLEECEALLEHLLH